MKTKLIILLFTFLSSHFYANAQAPNYLWAKFAGGVSDDNGGENCVDLNGNIIVAGTFNSSTLSFGTTILTNSGNYDLFVVKYDPNGNVLWAKSVGGASDEFGNSCTTDTFGNIIIAGKFSSTAISFGANILANSGSDDMFVVKYDPNGNVLWAKSAGGSAADNYHSCSTDAAGNIIAVGDFQSPTITFGTTTLTNTGNFDMVIVKYDPSGNILWANSSGGTLYDSYGSCTTDGLGNIIATGAFASSSLNFGTTVLNNTGSNDMLVVKYDSIGNLLWAKSASGSYADWGSDCSIDNAGNIIVSGSFRSPTLSFGTAVLTNVGFIDIFIVKFDPNGIALWAKKIGGINNEDYSNCIADSNGNIIVTGHFLSTTISIGATLLTNAGNYDLFIVKYNAGGNIIWVKSAGGTLQDFISKCSTDFAGNIIISGLFSSPSLSFGTTTLTNAGGYDMFIAKLDTSFITNVIAANCNNSVLLFPNPTDGNCAITFGNINKKAEVTITDITGKIIYANIATETKKIELNTKDFEEGIYLVQIQTIDLIETKKLIVTK